MSPFKLHWQLLELRLRHPFTISRGTKETVTNVLVTLEGSGAAGIGEAAPNARYDEDASSVSDYLQALPDNFFDDIRKPNELEERLTAFDRGYGGPPVRSASAAVQMAWLDLWAKKQGQPLWRIWGAPSGTGPQTSYTIGLDDIEVMQQKVREAAEFPVLKVKLGTGRDREIIRGIREVTDKAVRIDANEGWKSLTEAKAMIRFLAEQNIELVEQPLPAEALEDMKKLKAWSPLPLVADESYRGGEDLAEVAKAFDVINIKLMKIGSMVRARQVIEQANEQGLQIMIGCMIESSVANTAGAVLSLWADYADLDGHLLIKGDPAEGLKLDTEKRILINEMPGLGVSLRES